MSIIQVNRDYVTPDQFRGKTQKKVKTIFRSNYVGIYLCIILTELYHNFCRICFTNINHTFPIMEFVLSEFHSCLPLTHGIPIDLAWEKKSNFLIVIPNTIYFWSQLYVFFRNLFFTYYWVQFSLLLVVPSCPKRKICLSFLMMLCLCALSYITTTWRHTSI